MFKRVWSQFKHSTTLVRTKMNSTADQVQRNKQQYLQMSLEEKRRVYKCGSNHVEWRRIPSWAEQNRASSTSKTLLADKVCLFRGDITSLEVDAIVNAANEQLAGGGGVDGAIHAAAGTDLLQAECRLLNGCPTGQAKVTGGYRLPAQYIIHTVGPIGYHPQLLQQCYQNCIQAATKLNLRTIAFPCISTGVYGFPNQPAAEIALQTVREALSNDQANTIDRILFCVFLQKDFDIYSKLMLEYFPIERN